MLVLSLSDNSFIVTIWTIISFLFLLSLSSLKSPNLSAHPLSMRRQQYQLDQPLVRHQHSQNHDPSFWRPKAATPTSPRRATVRPSRNLGAISMGVATGRHNPPTFRRQLSSQTTSATDSEPIYTEIDDVILRRPIGRPQHVDYPAIPTSKPQPRPPVPAHPRMGRRAITQLDLKSRMPPPRECRPCLDPTAARRPLLPGAPCGSQVRHCNPFCLFVPGNS